jgi:hypothetical protein
MKLSAVAALVFAFIAQSLAAVETKSGNYLLAEAEHACNKFHYEFLRSRVWSACGAGFTRTQGNVCKKSVCENHKSTPTTTKTKTTTKVKTTTKAKNTHKKAKTRTKTKDEYLLAEFEHACSKFHFKFLSSRVWSACGAAFTRTQHKVKLQVGENHNKDEKHRKLAKATTKTHTQKRKTTKARKKQDKDKDDDKKTRRRIRQRHAHLYQSIKRRGAEKSEEL